MSKRKKDKKTLFNILVVTTIILSISLVGWASFRIANAISFEINCGAHIKRAASANTIDLARAELEKVINYAQQNNLTEGIVSIFIQNPANDVGFWYTNLTAAYDELYNVPEDASQLEKTNILIKLRESLTDRGETGGTQITVPSGISIFPHNVAYFWWGFFSIGGLLVGGTLFLLYFIEQEAKEEAKINGMRNKKRT